MGFETWRAVDEYVQGTLTPHDEALDAAVAASAAAGRKADHPGGRRRLRRGRPRQSGAGRRRSGGRPAGRPGARDAAGPARGGRRPFDLVFIDADKVHTPNYFAWSLDRCRPEGLIVADNVVRDGKLVDLDCEDPAIVAQRALALVVA
jgi:hypothetical protein